MRRSVLTKLLCGCLCAGLAAAMLSCCASSPTVTDDSPVCEEATITAYSDLTEASQVVEVRLAFPEALEANGDVAGDFDVMLNGEAPDKKTVAVSAAVEGNEVVVRLTPTSTADGHDPTVYFALSDGWLSIAAHDAQGALAHVRAAAEASQGACAVLPRSYDFTVPTGIAFDIESQRAGDAAANQPAQTTIRITRFAQVRCCSWFSFGEGIPVMMKHNHVFLRDTPTTCAANLAEMVNHTPSLGLAAEADGPVVTLTAVDARDGQLIAPALVEGLDADPKAGAYEAESM